MAWLEFSWTAEVRGVPVAINSCAILPPIYWESFLLLCSILPQIYRFKTHLLSHSFCRSESTGFSAQGLTGGSPPSSLLYGRSPFFRVRGLRPSPPRGVLLSLAMCPSPPHDCLLLWSQSESFCTDLNNLWLLDSLLKTYLIRSGPFRVTYLVINSKSGD